MWGNLHPLRSFAWINTAQGAWGSQSIGYSELRAEGARQHFHGEAVRYGDEIEHEMPFGRERYEVRK